MILQGDDLKAQRSHVKIWKERVCRRQEEWCKEPVTGTRGLV